MNIKVFSFILQITFFKYVTCAYIKENRVYKIGASEAGVVKNDERLKFVDENNEELIHFWYYEDIKISKLSSEELLHRKQSSNEFEEIVHREMDLSVINLDKETKLLNNQAEKVASVENYTYNNNVSGTNHNDGDGSGSKLHDKNYITFLDTLTDDENLLMAIIKTSSKTAFILNDYGSGSGSGDSYNQQDPNTDWYTTSRSPGVYDENGSGSDSGNQFNENCYYVGTFTDDEDLLIAAIRTSSKPVFICRDDDSGSGSGDSHNLQDPSTDWYTSSKSPDIYRKNGDGSGGGFSTENIEMVTEYSSAFGNSDVDYSFHEQTASDILYWYVTTKPSDRNNEDHGDSGSGSYTQNKDLLTDEPFSILESIDSSGSGDGSGKSDDYEYDDYFIKLDTVPPHIFKTKVGEDDIYFV